MPVTPLSPFTAARAILSNLEDLHVWTKGLATGQLLGPSTQRERVRWTAIPGGEPLDARYGLGILSLAGFVSSSVARSRSDPRLDAAEGNLAQRKRAAGRHAGSISTARSAGDVIVVVARASCVS
jgi:hypothetical protein